MTSLDDLAGGGRGGTLYGIGVGPGDVRYLTLRAAGLVRVHFSVSGNSRYSLRPHALDQLNVQLGRYLQAPTPSQERSHS